VFQPSCAKLAKAACGTKMNAKPVECWGNLRTPGSKFNRAKFFVRQQNRYWPCTLSEQRTPFS